MPTILDTNAKALQINLDAAAYGSFAEIGGGQEVSRWFFTVGGAAGTVAKTISAYDMTVSDAIYGEGPRYVSRERVRAMLDYEYKLLLARLALTRGDSTAFFVFADTVATRNYKGTNECHGWLGLRLQHAPGVVPSDIILHVSLRDSTAAAQQRTLGILGVNLIFAAFYQRGSRPEMLRALLDGLTLDNLEIDVLECTGPAFPQCDDPRLVALDMLHQGLTHAIIFDESGRPGQPSTVLRKRGVLLHRCSMRRNNPELDRMLLTASQLLKSEQPEVEHRPLAILELSISSVLANAATASIAADTSEPGSTIPVTPGGPSTPAPPMSLAEVEAPADAAKGNPPDPLARLNELMQPGRAVLLTNYAENFHVSQYLRRYSNEPVRFVIGIDALVGILKALFYKHIDGGLLEGLGRLLTPSTRLYAFAMPRTIFLERIALYGVDGTYCSVPEQETIGLADITLGPPAGHLLAFLRDSGWLVGVELPKV